MENTGYFVWNVSPELFSLGPITIRWYGLMFALGFFQGFYILTWMFRRENKRVEDLDDLLIYVFVGSLIGARLGHCLFYDPTFYLSHPLEILKIWKGGLASHGGAVGVLLAGLYFAWTKPDYTFLWMLDRGTVPLAVGCFCFRMGNLFNSEIIGISTSVPWAIIFERVDLLPRHPVQLYEGLSYALISLVLLFVYVKSGKRLVEGFLSGLFLVLMFTARFLLEFLKTRQASYSAEFDLSVGQWLSVPFILFGFLVLVKSYRKAL